MSARVEIRGIGGVRQMLQPWLEPELSRALDAATKKGAQAIAKDLRAELRPISRHMAKAVRVKRAKRERPAWVVGSRRKVAFFWPFVIGGTRDHGPRRADSLVFVPNWNPYIGASSHGIDTGRVVRTKRVRGVRANPVVSRVADRYGDRALDAAERTLPK